jgi:hypothetical protein
MLTTKKLASAAFLGLYDEGAGEDNWEPGPEDGIVSNVKYTKKSDHLYLYFENGSDDGIRSWITTDTYDLTNVDIIEAEIAYGEPGGSVSESYFLAIDPTNSYGSPYNAEKYDKWSPYNSPGERTVHQLDVSGKSGEYYVAAHFQITTNYEPVEFYLYRVERDP